MMNYLMGGNWLLWVGAAFVFVSTVVILYARSEASRGRRAALSSELKPGTAAGKILVVLVHGFAGGKRAIEGVEGAVRQVMPQADILLFEFASHLYSNADPCHLAWQMQEEINRKQDENRYDRIMLCGYSMGALLVRKAYVYGCGSVADAPVSDGLRSTKFPVQDWVRRVDRFVLLCGVNRGWSLDANFRHGPSAKRFLQRVGRQFARLTDTAQLIRKCERGEPFVANLRLQWLEVTAAEGLKNPTVVQLLGDIDDVVSHEDSRDVTVARDFIWVTVNNTGHAGMVMLGDVGTPLERKLKIQQAFGDAQAVERLRRMNPSVVLDEDKHVNTVVFILHGIRDMGDWTSRFEKPLQDAYLERNSDKESKVYVHRAGYGYFAMGPFLLWADRQKNVRWFMDQITELTARFPNLRNIHFIGHSNGTYILASALVKYATLKLDRVALAGSVIRRDFKWGHFQGRVGQIRNYVGASDLVVGLFPRVFELPLFGLFNRDLGSAGFNGFEDGWVQSMQTQFVKGGHGAALQAENMQSIVDFIVDGKKTDASTLLVDDHPGWLAYFSNLCWVLWIILAVLLIAGFWYSPVVGTVAAHYFAPGFNITPSLMSWLCRGGYTFFVWMLLKTL